MSLESHVNNLIRCLRRKTSIEQKIRNPKIKIVFAIGSVASAYGENLPHLFAVDEVTRTKLYLAEVNDVGEWITSRNSQFSEDIYFFCDHIIEQLQYESSRELSAIEQGKILQQIATRVFNNNNLGS